jgi:catechol 2,3-dioxygenase-like lactoylglutathione lyase family enzyme
MFNGGNVTIYVTDMDRAVAFYTDTLGLSLIFRAGDHWADIDAGAGLHIGLHPASTRVPAPGTAGAVTLGLRIDEPIEHVVALLEQRGVVVDGPDPDAEGRLRLAFFTDPDGNPLYLAEVGSR